MAGRARRGTDVVLRAGASAGPARAIGLYRGRRAGGHAVRPAAGTSAVPVHPGPQRLAPCLRGAGRRELPGAECRIAGGALDGRRSARGAPHRQPLGGV
jgi:hypothetical protein